MRIRTVKPGFFSSRSNARLPISTRLTFIGLWCYCDDAGRGVDEPLLIKAAVWPLDEDYTVAQITKDLEVLADAGKIDRYQVDGESYLQVRNWGHQRINRPTASDLPPPPPEDSRRTHGGLTEDSPEEGKGKERKGKEGNRERGGARATPAPDTFDIDDGLREWAAKNVPSTMDIDRQTERFLDYHRAKGTDFKDWRAAWRNWMSRAEEYTPRSNGQGPSDNLRTIARAIGQEPR